MIQSLHKLTITMRGIQSEITQRTKKIKKKNKKTGKCDPLILKRKDNPLTSTQR